MFRLALRTVFAKKRRFLSTALSIMLGIAFLAGTLVFTDTMNRTFDNLFADIYADTDTVVRAASSVEDDMGFTVRGRIPEATVATVRQVDGVAELIRRLVHAFDYDIGVRNVLDRMNCPWLTPDVVEFNDVEALETSDFRATAFRVDHGPVDQAFGLRLDADAGSVAFSGDTRPLESLALAAEGVDILVHEVYDATLARDQIRVATERFGAESNFVRARAGVIGYHTLSQDLGPIATLADTPHLVLNHVIGPTDSSSTRSDIARGYGGTITVGADLQEFEIGRR